MEQNEQYINNFRSSVREARVEKTKTIKKDFCNIAEKYGYRLKKIELDGGGNSEVILNF